MHVIRAHKTADGQVFEDEREATVHETKHLVHKWCEDHRIGHGGPWDADMVAEEMVEHADELGDILLRYMRARGGMVGQPPSAPDDTEDDLVPVVESADGH